MPHNDTPKIPRKVIWKEKRKAKRKKCTTLVSTQCQSVGLSGRNRECLWDERERERARERGGGKGGERGRGQGHNPAVGKKRKHLAVDLTPRKYQALHNHGRSLAPEATEMPNEELTLIFSFDMLLLTDRETLRRLWILCPRCKAQIPLASRRDTWFGTYQIQQENKREKLKEKETKKKERKPMVGPEDWFSCTDTSVGCEGRRPDTARIPSRPRRAVERHEYRAIMWTSGSFESGVTPCLQYQYSTLTLGRKIR